MVFHSREIPCRPRLALAVLPTPVEPFLGLAGGERVPQLWIKRDDASSGQYGGNKVRKLEYLLAEAKAADARALLTVGGVGSHHVVATACFGHQLGLDTHAVVAPQPFSARVALNVALGAAWEARYHLSPHLATVPLALAWQRLVHPGIWYIPPGGSTPVGALGYVDAGLELAAQLRSGELPLPRMIVVATGSGGTQAGLVVGLALAGLEIPVLGVRVVPRWWLSEARLIALAGATARLVGLPGDASRWRPLIRLTHDYAGRGYGHATPEARQVAAPSFLSEGLVLETTYTAKAFVAALDLAKAASGPILYWHTADGQTSRPSMDARGVKTRLPPALRSYMAFDRPTRLE